MFGNIIPKVNISEALFENKVAEAGRDGKFQSERGTQIGQILVPVEVPAMSLRMPGRARGTLRGILLRIAIGKLRPRTASPIGMSQRDEDKDTGGLPKGSLWEPLPGKNSRQKSILIFTQHAAGM